MQRSAPYAGAAVMHLVLMACAYLLFVGCRSSMLIRECSCQTAMCFAACACSCCCGGVQGPAHH
jgi:hypothetical protein